jgi:predicted permease
LEEVNQPALSSLSAFDRQRFLSRKVLVERAASGYSDLRREYATVLNVLMAMAVLALLIVCSNVANLLLARASARQQEMAVRLAIGAPRGALVRQLFIESLLLALLGAALGIGVAAFGTRELLRMLPRHGASLALHAAPDWRVLLFSLAIATVTGLLFGFAPALQSARPAVRGGLHAAPAEISGRRSSKTRSLLVATQLALSFLLLVGAALFTRTLTNLKEARTGFADLSRVVSFQVDPARAGYTLPRIRTLYSAVLNDIQAEPKVKSAAYSMWPLLNGERWDLTVMVEGHKAAPGENMQSLYNVVSPGFFRTVGVPLLQGRDFTENDRFEGNDPALVPKVAIVNRAFAERFFGKESPIGRHIGCCRGTATSEDIEIVGMVENSIVGSPRQAVESEVFFSYLQSTIPRTVTFYVRSDEDENFVARAARSAFARYDDTLPLFAVKTVEAQVAETLSTEQMIASLSSVFGALAAVLAGIGLYGVLAFTVGLRTKEIALRIALGSSRKSVLWLVLRSAFVILAGGLAAGILAAAALSPYIASQLFGVKPTNAWIYTEVVLVL